MEGLKLRIGTYLTLLLLFAWDVGFAELRDPAECNRCMVVRPDVACCDGSAICSQGTITYTPNPYRPCAQVEVNPSAAAGNAAESREPAVDPGGEPIQISTPGSPDAGGEPRLLPEGNKSGIPGAAPPPRAQDPGGGGSVF